MKQHQGIWLPDHETHLTEWMTRNGEIVDGRGTYQIKKLRAALARVKQFRTAVDIGGHVGLWSLRLAPRFRSLHAFEPVAAHRECWLRNLEGVQNAVLHPEALGAAPGRVAMNTETGSSGNTRVVPGDEVELRTLDSYGLQDVDFIKIDCEGYEHAVLLGAEQTLRACAPVVIVEQKPRQIRDFGHTRPEAVEFLKSLGAVLVCEIGGDYIMEWPGA